MIPHISKRPPSASPFCLPVHPLSPQCSSTTTSPPLFLPGLGLCSSFPPEWPLIAVVDSSNLPLSIRVPFPQSFQLLSNLPKSGPFWNRHQLPGIEWLTAQLSARAFPTFQGLPKPLRSVAKPHPAQPPHPHNALGLTDSSHGFLLTPGPALAWH